MRVPKGRQEVGLQRLQTAGPQPMTLWKRRNCGDSSKSCGCRGLEGRQRRRVGGSLGSSGQLYPVCYRNRRTRLSELTDRRPPGANPKVNNGLRGIVVKCDHFIFVLKGSGGFSF